jgi:site-specific recombinase XerD
LETRSDALEAPEGLELLPPVLAGDETPAVQARVGRFYASVQAMLQAWLARRQSPNTRLAYRRDVLDFVAFLGLPTESIENAGRQVETIHQDHAWALLQVTVPQVQAWRDYLYHECNAAPNTLNRRVSSVSGFFRFMRETAAEAKLPITEPNPAHSQFISRETQEPVTPTEALSSTRARQIMSISEGESVLANRNRAVLKFYLYTGCRIGAGCRLLVEDFIDSEEDPKVRIQEKVAWQFQARPRHQRHRGGFHSGLHREGGSHEWTTLSCSQELALGSAS